MTELTNKLRLIESLKHYLIDCYNVCVLDNMKGPVDLNIINGKRYTFQAHSETFSIYLSSFDIAKKITGDHGCVGVDPSTFNQIFKSDITHFAFYNIIEEDDGHQIRYAGVRVE